jgi:uncharacterized membrane protein
MGWCWNGFGWGSWGLGESIVAILGLVFVAGVLAVLGLTIAWLVRQVNRRSTATVVSSGVDPLEIARRRLAAGEITIAEFEEISDRLRR